MCFWLFTNTHDAEFEVSDYYYILLKNEMVMTWFELFFGEDQTLFYTLVGDMYGLQN
jgi:hypothetical protein